MIIAVLVAAASGASADAPRLDVKSSHKVVLRGEPFVVTWEMPSRDYRVISVTSLKVDGAALLRRSSELSGLEQIVIPERAGPLTIPPITYALERTADGSASSVTSPPLTISVQENADALLPASNVHLECSSSRSGDTITQSTRVTAFADLRNALPRFRQPPAVAFEESTSDQGLLDDVYGLRMLKTVTRTAKVPAAQAFVVPPIDFPFRDTTTGLPSVARCQGSVILPLEGDLRKAAADAAAAAAPQTKSESPSPVRWIFPPLLLIASIVIFTFPRKRKARVPVIATRARKRC